MRHLTHKEGLGALFFHGCVRVLCDSASLYLCGCVLTLTFLVEI